MRNREVPMLNVTEHMFFGGAQQKLDRLGMKGLWNELENVLTGFQVCLYKHDRRDAAIVLRRLLDNRFRSLSNWNEIQGIQRAGASHYPVAVLALEHDGPGPALTKRRTRQGKKPID
jgi:hypothetical protein